MMRIGDTTGIIAKKADTTMETPIYEEVSAQKTLERSQEELKKDELERDHAKEYLQRSQ